MQSYNQGNKMRPQPVQTYDNDIASDKTQVIMSPKSRHSTYENLYFQVMQHEDPKHELNRIVMRDQRTYDMYKDGLHEINTWIDKELAKRMRQR